MDHDDYSSYLELKASSNIISSLF